MSATQCETILRLLRERGERGLTPLDALELAGSFRLGARIWDLRQQGHDIRSETVTTAGGSRVARYVLVEPAEQLSWTA
jgi:hypothetical protein